MCVPQELQGKTAEFRRRLKAGAALDSLLVEGQSPYTILPPVVVPNPRGNRVHDLLFLFGMCLSVCAAAFAVVRESSWRVLGQRHFDVQLMGGLALHEGRLAEMATGEGKTLAAMLPTYLNARSGKRPP